VGQIDDIGIHTACSAGLRAQQVIVNDSSQATVLIADDDSVSRSFRAAIERCGCAVLAVADARRAAGIALESPTCCLSIDTCPAWMVWLCAAAAQELMAGDRDQRRTRCATDRNLCSGIRRDPVEAGQSRGNSDYSGLPRDAILPTDATARAEASGAVADDAAALTAIGGDRDALRLARMFARNSMHFPRT
jgi:hypothetical protein